MVVAAGVATAVGAGTQAYGARKAAKQQAAAGERAYQTQADAQARAEELLSPYSKAGGVAQNELMGMLGIGGQQSTYENPMLKQIQAQALQGATNRNAATGRATGAGMGSAIAQSLLQPAYQMQQSRIGQLQGLTNMGMSAASSQAGMNANIAGQMAGSQVNVGNAQAAGTAGMYGAIGEGISQFGGYAGNYGQQQDAAAAAAKSKAGYRPTVPVSSQALIKSPLAVNPMEQENFRFYNF